MSESGGSLAPIAVVGTGTMGRGIAQLCAAAGYPTRLCDVDMAIAEAAIEAIRGSLQRRVDKGKLTAQERQATLDRLVACDDLAAAVAEVGMAIESVPERLDLKLQVLTKVRDAAQPDAILASNTSGL